MAKKTEKKTPSKKQNNAMSMFNNIRVPKNETAKREDKKVETTINEVVEDKQETEKVHETAIEEQIIETQKVEKAPLVHEDQTISTESAIAEQIYENPDEVNTEEVNDNEHVIAETTVETKEPKITVVDVAALEKAQAQKEYEQKIMSENRTKAHKDVTVNFNRIKQEKRNGNTRSYYMSNRNYEKLCALAEQNEVSKSDMLNYILDQVL